MTETEEVRRARARLTGLLDDVHARRTLPAGARGRIYAVLDMLRGCGAPSDEIVLAERIALTLHALEWARLRKSAEHEEGLWRDLEDLRTRWLQASLGGSGNGRVAAAPVSPVDAPTEPAYFTTP